MKETHPLDLFKDGFGLRPQRRSYLTFCLIIWKRAFGESFCLLNGKRNVLRKTKRYGGGGIGLGGKAARSKQQQQQFHIE